MSPRRGEGAGTKLPPLYFPTARDMVLFWITFAVTAIPVFYGLVSSFWVMMILPEALLLMSWTLFSPRQGIFYWSWMGISFGNLAALFAALVSLLYR